MLKNPGGGHKSLLKKSVSHSEIKTSQSLHPPGGGGSVGGRSGESHFFLGISRQKSLKKCGAKSLLHFGTPPPGGGVSGPKFSKSQSVTFKKSVSHPPGGGVSAATKHWPD